MKTYIIYSSLAEIFRRNGNMVSAYYWSKRASEALLRR